MTEREKFDPNGAGILHPAAARILARWKLARGPEYSLKKSVNLRGVKIGIRHRKKDSTFGRFGGGWEFQLGVQASGTEVIIHYGIGSIRIINYRKLSRKYPETYTHNGPKPREEKP